VLKRTVNHLQTVFDYNSIRYSLLNPLDCVITEPVVAEKALVRKTSSFISDVSDTTATHNAMHQAPFSGGNEVRKSSVDYEAFGTNTLW